MTTLLNTTVEAAVTEQFKKTLVHQPYLDTDIPDEDSEKPRQRD